MSLSEETRVLGIKLGPFFYILNYIRFLKLS